MNKKKLIAIAVVSAMHNGYRRAGLPLVKGTNELEVTQEQLDQLKADNSLAVTLTSTDSIERKETSTDDDLPNQYKLVLGQNASLKKQINDLTVINSGLTEDINEFEAQLKVALAAAKPAKVTASETSKVVEILGLDLLDAPVELNEMIAAIHVMNTKESLTQKPNCDQFGELKVSAAQRDEAWAWYQENVVTTDVKDSE